MSDIFYSKVMSILKCLKKEYLKIEKIYSENNIFKNSLPIKASKKCDSSQRKEVQKIIKNFFFPFFPTLSKMIDAGIIEISEIDSDVKLGNSNIKKEVMEKLVYESWDKLYINKYIKYNINMSFIMQLYITFERELVYFMKENFKENFNDNTLFGSIKFLEKSFKCEFDSTLKEKIDMYRNIINVYKHGNGTSYNEIVNKHPEILNMTLNCDNLDTTFLFNFDKIKFENLFLNLTEMLENIKNANGNSNGKK